MLPFPLLPKSASSGLVSAVSSIVKAGIARISSKVQSKIRRIAERTVSKIRNFFSIGKGQRFRGEFVRRDSQNTNRGYLSRGYPKSSRDKKKYFGVGRISANINKVRGHSKIGGQTIFGISSTVAKITRNLGSRSKKTLGGIKNWLGSSWRKIKNWWNRNSLKIAKKLDSVSFLTGILAIGAFAAATVLTGGLAAVALGAANILFATSAVTSVASGGIMVIEGIRRKKKSLIFEGTVNAVLGALDMKALGILKYQKISKDFYRVFGKKMNEGTLEVVVHGRTPVLSEALERVNKFFGRVSEVILPRRVSRYLTEAIEGIGKAIREKIPRVGKKVIEKMGRILKKGPGKILPDFGKVGGRLGKFIKILGRIREKTLESIGRFRGIRKKIFGIFRRKVLDIGEEAEKVARKYLKDLGYEIVFDQKAWKKLRGKLLSRITDKHISGYLKSVERFPGKDFVVRKGRVIVGVEVKGDKNLWKIFKGMLSDVKKRGKTIARKFGKVWKGEYLHKVKVARKFRVIMKRIGIKSEEILAYPKWLVRYGSDLGLSGIRLATKVVKKFPRLRRLTIIVKSPWDIVRDYILGSTTIKGSKFVHNWMSSQVKSKNNKGGVYGSTVRAYNFSSNWRRLSKVYYQRLKMYYRRLRKRALRLFGKGYSFLNKKFLRRIKSFFRRYRGKYRRYYTRSRRAFGKSFTFKRIRRYNRRYRGLGKYWRIYSRVKRHYRRLRRRLRRVFRRSYRRYYRKIKRFFRRYYRKRYRSWYRRVRRYFRRYRHKYYRRMKRYRSYRRYRRRYYRRVRRLFRRYRRSFRRLYRRVKKYRLWKRRYYRRRYRRYSWRRRRYFRRRYFRRYRRWYRRRYRRIFRRIRRYFRRYRRRYYGRRYYRRRSYRRYYRRRWR